MNIRMQESESTLATQIYRRLRNDILDGRLTPGSKLKVQEIAAGYGVGASPIREALSSLAAEGLVERHDQRGFRAAPATMAEFEELLRARCWLEEACLRQSILAGGKDWEEKVVLANYRLTRMEDKPLGQQPDGEEAHNMFHDALLAACPSPTLVGFCQVLRDRQRRYRKLAHSLSYPMRNVKVEHSGIAEAALARDVDRACRLLSEHYGITSRYVRVALDRTRTAPDAIAMIS